MSEKIFIIQPVDENYTPEDLNELKELVFSADAQVVGECLQKIREISPATYIGKGKLDEINQILQTEVDADCVLFNGDLSPSQTLNISEALSGVKVIDRTTLILDIFALHAKTNEGKLQVELAQLKYIYPRLKGKGQALSRLAGGIGTRGPGETKLETDRRYIRQRIRNLENNLTELKNRRKLQSDRREKNDAKFIALVGYTNSGKSTLMNRLTDANVLTENKLFATLDPTLRKFVLPFGEAIMADTVGFLKNIPHNLIEAFKSTLETANEADLILTVTDASSNDWTRQLEVTLQTLKDLNCKGEIFNIFNKCDLISDYSYFPKDGIFISALTGDGIDNLKDKIFDFFKSQYVSCRLFIPYSKTAKYARLKNFITVEKEEYTSSGILSLCTVQKRYFSDIAEFIIKDNDN